MTHGLPRLVHKDHVLLRRPPRVLDLRWECARFLIKKHLLSGVADIFFFSYLKTRKKRMNFKLLR